MNTPPKSGIRIPPDELEALIIALFEKAGTSRAHAEVMGQLLIQTDLRGIVSHGTQKAPEYLRLLPQGRVTPRPSIRVVHETTTTRVIDGDGDDATSSCYLNLIDAANNGATIVTGMYRDRLRKVDGTWKFVERNVSIDSTD